MSIEHVGVVGAGVMGIGFYNGAHFMDHYLDATFCCLPCGLGSCKARANNMKFVLHDAILFGGKVKREG